MLSGSIAVPISASTAVPVGVSIAVPVSRSIAVPVSRLSAVAVARPIAEPIADRLAATAIPITTTVARPTTEPVADGLAAATAPPIRGLATATVAGSIIQPAADRLAHPNATPVRLVTAAVTRPLIEPVAERTTVPAAGPIRRSTTATIACPIIEPAAERIVVPAAVTTTVAHPITERITIPVGRAVVAVRVDNSGVARVDDPVGCEIGQLLVDVAEQVEGLVVEQLGAVAVGQAGAQQTIGVVEVVERGIDQLALVVGEIHDGVRGLGEGERRRGLVGRVHCGRPHGSRTPRTATRLASGLVSSASRTCSRCGASRSMRIFSTPPCPSAKMNWRGVSSGRSSCRGRGERVPSICSYPTSMGTLSSRSASAWASSSSVRPTNTALTSDANPDTRSRSPASCDAKQRAHVELARVAGEPVDEHLAGGHLRQEVRLVERDALAHVAVGARRSCAGSATTRG